MAASQPQPKGLQPGESISGGWTREIRIGHEKAWVNAKPELTMQPGETEENFHARMTAVTINSIDFQTNEYTEYLEGLQ